MNGWKKFKYKCGKIFHTHCFPEEKNDVDDDEQIPHWTVQKPACVQLSCLHQLLRAGVESDLSYSRVHEPAGKLHSDILGAEIQQLQAGILF